MAVNAPTQKKVKIKPDQNHDINILLLGETGVGKSTFINAIENYCQFKNFECAANNILILLPTIIRVTDKEGKAIKIRFESDDNEAQKVNDGSTQRVKTYVFPLGNTGQKMRLIDSPGMGSAKGEAQDDANCENILAYLSQLEELHAICFLLKPTGTRNTFLFEYCVKQILSRLGKPSAKNIIFIFTNTRETNYSLGDALPSLQRTIEDIKAKAPYMKIPTENNVFSLDNEAFNHLVAMLEGVKFDEHVIKSCMESWDVSSDACRRLIKYIIGDNSHQQLKPYQLQDSTSINESRRLIVCLSQPLADILQLIDDNIRLLEGHKANLKMEIQSVDALKTQMYIPITDLKIIDLTRPVTVCTSSKCAKVVKIDDKNRWSYLQRCHESCDLAYITKQIINDPQLNDCTAMDETGNCTKCSCNYSLHMHLYYMTEYVDVKIIQEITTETEILLETQRLINEIDMRTKELEDERNTILFGVAKFAHFWQCHAITPFNDSYKEYIEHLITREASLGDLSDGIAIASLQNLLQKYAEFKGILENIQIGKGTNALFTATSTEIKNTIQQLYRLKNVGKTIEELLTKQIASRKWEHDQSCEYVSTPINIRDLENSANNSEDNHEEFLTDQSKTSEDYQSWEHVSGSLILDDLENSTKNSENKLFDNHENTSKKSVDDQSWEQILGSLVVVDLENSTKHSGDKSYIKNQEKLPMNQSTDEKLEDDQNCQQMSKSLNLDYSETVDDNSHNNNHEKLLIHLNISRKSECDQNIENVSELPSLGHLENETKISGNKSCNNNNEELFTIQNTSKKLGDEQSGERDVGDLEDLTRNSGDESYINNQENLSLKQSMGRKLEDDQDCEHISKSLNLDYLENADVDSHNNYHEELLTQQGTCGKFEYNLENCTNNSGDKSCNNNHEKVSTKQSISAKLEDGQICELDSKSISDLESATKNYKLESYNNHEDLFAKQSTSTDLENLPQNFKDESYNYYHGHFMKQVTFRTSQKDQSCELVSNSQNLGHLKNSPENSDSESSNNNQSISKKLEHDQSCEFVTKSITYDESSEDESFKSFDSENLSENFEDESSNNNFEELFPIPSTSGQWENLSKSLDDDSHINNNEEPSTKQSISRKSDHGQIRELILKPINLSDLESSSENSEDGSYYNNHDESFTMQNIRRELEDDQSCQYVSKLGGLHDLDNNQKDYESWDVTKNEGPTNVEEFDSRLFQKPLHHQFYELSQVSYTKPHYQSSNQDFISRQNYEAPQNQLNESRQSQHNWKTQQQHHNPIQYPIYDQPLNQNYRELQDQSNRHSHDQDEILLNQDENCDHSSYQCYCRQSQGYHNKPLQEVNHQAFFEDNSIVPAYRGPSYDLNQQKPSRDSNQISKLRQESSRGVNQERLYYESYDQNQYQPKQILQSQNYEPRRNIKHESILNTNHGFNQLQNNKRVLQSQYRPEISLLNYEQSRYIKYASSSESGPGISQGQRHHSSYVRNYGSSQNQDGSQQFSQDQDFQPHLNIKYESSLPSNPGFSQVLRNELSYDQNYSPPRNDSRSHPSAQRFQYQNAPHNMHYELSSDTDSGFNQAQRNASSFAQHYGPPQNQYQPKSSLPPSHDRNYDQRGGISYRSPGQIRGFNQVFHCDASFDQNYGSPANKGGSHLSSQFQNQNYDRRQDISYRSPNCRFNQVQRDDLLYEQNYETSRSYYGPQ